LLNKPDDLTSMCKEIGKKIILLFNNIASGINNRVDIISNNRMSSERDDN